MITSYTKPTLFVLLVKIGSIAIVTAEPGQNTKPEVGQAPAIHSELELFPPAKDGMQRYFIVLPQKEKGEEDAFRVELMPGMMMETDGVNFYSLGNILEKKELKGFGYDYYVIKGGGPVAMTMIGSDPKAAPVKKFVTGLSLHLGYNSRLPIVIYAPAGYEIRYRIWKVDEAVNTAPKG